MSVAAGQALNDCILTHSMRGMFQSFFIKGRDNVASMEAFLSSFDNAGIGNDSLKSNRPSVRATSKEKLSKLVLFLMKTKGEGSLTESEFVSF